MKRLILILLTLSISISLFAHPWKPAHYVIIDTDGGIDDMRAINLLLASPNVRILAITTSSGALSAENAWLKVKSLLNSCYHEGLPAGINRMKGFKSPDFPVALQTRWGNEAGLVPGNAPEAISLIRELLLLEKTKVSFVCLGGMNTVNLAIAEIPDFKSEVKDIVWSSDGVEDTKGFNFNIDREAALKVLSGNVPVKLIRKPGESGFYDETLIEKIKNINSVYAKKVSDFFSSEITKNHTYSFSGNDDMVPLFMHYPELFKNNDPARKGEFFPFDTERLREKTLTILSGETVARNQVIKALPNDTSFYFSDLQPHVLDIIGKYGIDEWTSGVIANELHRHLGVFAIIGVKMGIRAREYFCTGVDEFNVTSFAGSIPPLSCMNDGVQVSTGATPGHGLLTVINDAASKPAAEFRYLNRKIRITLKPEIAAKISSELKEINFVYGLDSDIYWELVRKNSIIYWRNLDRHEIFEITEIK